MSIAACEDPGRISVSKTLVGPPYGTVPASQEGTFVDGDPVTFLIVVKNHGGESVTVTLTDDFDAVFTGRADPGDPVDWTRTGPTGVVTTGTGNISNTQALTSGQSYSYLVEAAYHPEDCTSLTVNIAVVTLPGSDCCGANEIYSAVRVFNGTDGAPAVRLDPVEGYTAMEALFWLVENLTLPDKARLASFVNACGNLSDLVSPEGGSGIGDGVAVAILDAFGDPTGLFAETSAGS